MSVINTMTISQMVDDLMSDECASWTRLGAYAIAEYLDEMSEDMGEPIEWDRVAVRCDYSEYTLRDVLHNFGGSLNLDWQAIAVELIDGGEFPFDDLIEELQEHTGCVLHVVQGTNPLTGETDEDTFIVEDF